MKKNDQNKIAVFDQNSYEEIGWIPETVINNIDIDGDERIEEDSIIDINSINDYKEINHISSSKIKSLTIIDELEDGTVKKDKSKAGPSINIGKLASRINNLTFIRKKKKPVFRKSKPEENKISKIDKEHRQTKKEKSTKSVEDLKFTPKTFEKTGRKTEKKIPKEINKDESITSTVFESKEDTVETEEILTDVIIQDQVPEIQKEPESLIGKGEKAEAEEKSEVSEHAIPETPDERTSDIITDEKQEKSKELTESLIEKADAEHAEPKKEITDDIETTEEEKIEYRTQTVTETFEQESQDTAEKITQDFKTEDEKEHGEEELEHVQTSVKTKHKESLEEEIKSEKDSDTDKHNFLSIEIPDNLLKKIPKNFNIDELGKIDLNEAEIIASEDFLSLTKGKIIEGLEDLDIFTKAKADSETSDSVSEKSVNEPVKEEVIPNEQSEIKTEEDIKENAEKSLTDRQETQEETADFQRHETDEKEAIKKPTEPVTEKTDMESAEPDKKFSDDIETTAAEEEKEKKEKKVEETKHTESEKNDIPEIIEKKDIETDKPDDPYESPDSFESNNSLEEFSLIEEIEIDEENSHINIKDKNTNNEYVPSDMTGNQNVYFIDSENESSYNLNNSIFERDELEDLSSGIIDTADGMSKQLLESDISDNKTVTGLIRDNYPTFVDLLKEAEDKPKYFTDDIDFVDSSFITKNNISQISEEIDSPESIEQEKSTSYETATGLVPEEIELIENQLFDITVLDTVKEESVEKIAGLDQHPDDTITLKKYKYILPFPESLNEDEKKSIEDDLSNKNALILEEDVEKIKKKLEDSMKKKIEETIQDITDKITIYEENKKNNNDTVTDKEDIKKLLQYLNELFGQLPEESVKNFADSEYYNLYKKVLKEMEE